MYNIQMTFSRVFLVGLFFFYPFIQTVSGQADRRSVRQGNRLYQEQQFGDAEIKYRESLQENPGNIEGMFNLGNSLYRQERYKEASQKFEALTRISQDDQKRAYAYHNWGNSLLKSQDFAGSVSAFKNALRINPMDDQTRFNLAYALQKLQEQQNQSGQGNREQNEQNRNEQDSDQNRNEQHQQNQSQQPQPRP
ncbi:MAG TPA: tetratricopeptide repeat protein, partial [Bacteroidales bacterium]|nr:tetratricopeptide repeat protein [Bacteroidales bacterium]